MVTKEQVLKALSQIIDPDFQKDIVSLGFIKELEINEGKVSFKVELTTPACPLKSKFKADAENVVKEIEGVEEVKVTMTAREVKKETLLVDLKKSNRSLLLHPVKVEWENPLWLQQLRVKLQVEDIK